MRNDLALSPPLSPPLDAAEAALADRVDPLGGADAHSPFATTTPDLAAATLSGGDGVA